MDERDKRQRSRVREAALLRTARVKRWVASGALALTGIFSALAAAVLPASHASSSTPSPSQAPAVSSDDGTGEGDQSRAQSSTPSQSSQSSTPSQSSQSAQPSQSQPVTPSIAPPAAVPQVSGSGSGAVSGGS
jgi:hypothetical protein